MRLLVLVSLFIFSSPCLTAQQLPEWYRVYTFDESIIEMNTSLVTVISKDIARVRFRWTFDQPETLSGEPQLKYKSRLEVMEFKCSERRFRPYHLTYFEATGDIVRLEENPVDEWRKVTSGSMMEKLFEPACKLIKKKTRTPVASSEKTTAKYKVGQMWSYKTRAGEEDSYFIIVKIDNDAKLGTIVHIAMRGLKMKNPRSPDGISDKVNHMPFNEEAVNKSALRLLKDKAELPDYEEGYQSWRNAFDAGRAGVYTITLAEAVNVMEESLNQ
jgi:mRNA-degrading endonuclease RelE of RelBE toxin-antitoxin system